MLNHLKKFLQTKETQVASEDNQGESEMTVTATNQPVLADTAEMANLFAEQTATLEQLQADFSTLTAQLTEAKSALSAIESEKASLVAKAAEEKQAARKEKLENAVGTVKASALLTSLESLDDTAFNTVVEAMEMNLDAEANSAAFKETGVTAEAKVPQEASFVESLTASITKKLTK